MRDDDGGGPEFGIDALQRFQHPHTGGRIKGAGRLVAQHHHRALGNGARNGHALLLATRELRREMIQPLAQSHHCQGLIGRHRVGCNIGNDGNVFARRQAGNQVVELEYKAHMLAPEARQPSVSGMRQVFAVVPDMTAAGHVQPAQNIEQGRFPTARRPKQNNELPCAQLQIDASQGVHLDIAHAVNLRQALRPKDRICVLFRHAICVRMSCGHSGTSSLLSIAPTQG